MKKALRIFVFCLTILAFFISYLLLKIFTLCYNGLNWLEGVILKSFYKQRGNLKRGVWEWEILIICKHLPIPSFLFLKSATNYKGLPLIVPLWASEGFFLQGGIKTKCAQGRALLNFRKVTYILFAGYRLPAKILLRKK